MGFHFPSIRMPPPPRIHIPPIRLPPPPKPIHIPPVRLPPPPKPIHIPPVRLPPPPPPIHIPPIHLPPPLPPPPKPEINMKALKESLGIIAGGIALNPIGKLLVTGVMGIADLSTGGKASDFINDGHKMNTTLSMMPAGMLIQQIANDASDGKSGDALTKYIPDPKRMIIHDVVTVGKTIVTNPTDTLNITQTVLKQNVKAVENFTPVVALKPAGETLQNIMKPVVDLKPTLNPLTSIQNIISPPPKKEEIIPEPNTLFNSPVIVSTPMLPSTLPPVSILPTTTVTRTSSTTIPPVVSGAIAPILGVVGLAVLAPVIGTIVIVSLLLRR